MKVLVIRHWILDIDLTFVIRHLKLFIILLFLFINIASFSYGSVSGYSSLRIIPSARECAMGGTGVVSGLGPQAMYYNPALTSNITSFAVNVNYAKWFLDMYEQSIFLVRPFSSFNLGLGIVNFNAGKLDFRPDYPTDDPIDNFQPVDFNFLFNFSKKTEQEKYQTSFGVSGRFYYQKISEYTATAVGADAGFSIDLPYNLQAGFAIKDFATSMEFVREEFSLPTKLVGGLTYKIQISTFKIQNSLDVGYFYKNKELNFYDGLELTYNDKYFLRSGYKLSDNSNNYNLGFGLIVKNIRFEYALSPNNLDLGNTHHFSIGLGY
jgi:hypothetical protein